MTVRVNAIRMTCPIQPGPFFLAAPNWVKPAKHFHFLRTNNRHLTVRSSIAAASTQWGKPSNLWAPYVYSLRPRVPSWIWIGWIQSASHWNNSKSPFNFGYVSCGTKYRSDSQPFHPWATFSGDIHTSLPKWPGPLFHGWWQRSCPQPANTTFAILWRTYLPHTYNNALT